MTTNDHQADTGRLPDSVLEAATRAGLRFERLVRETHCTVVYDAVHAEFGPCTAELGWPGQQASSPPTAEDLARATHALTHRYESFTYPFSLIRPLPPLRKRMQLGPVAAVLVKRIEGLSVRELMPLPHGLVRGVISKVALALRTLHSGFGAHGNLSPERIVLDFAPNQVVFLEPACCERGQAPSRYALPSGADDSPGDRMLRDVAALAAIAAELRGEAISWTNGRPDFPIGDVWRRRVLMQLRTSLSRPDDGRFAWAFEAAGLYADRLIERELGIARSRFDEAYLVERARELLTRACQCCSGVVLYSKNKKKLFVLRAQQRGAAIYADDLGGTCMVGFATPVGIFTKRCVRMSPSECPETRELFLGKEWKVLYQPGKFRSEWVTSLTGGLERARGELKTAIQEVQQALLSIGAEAGLTAKKAPQASSTVRRRLPDAGLRDEGLEELIRRRRLRRPTRGCVIRDHDDGSGRGSED